MSTKSTNMPEGLRTMLTEALHAYGLAHATQLQTERQAKAEQQKRLQLLQTQQQAQIQQVQTNHKKDESIADAKLERIGHLMTAIEEVKKSSGELLEKAGLAHVAGAPLRLNDSAASVRDMNETVVSLFAAAQLAYVDLKAALLRLATAYIDEVRYDEARRVLQPLLEDAEDPLYKDARDLLCETYYEPTLAALTAEDWAAAREGLEAVLKIDTAYRDSTALLRETYTRPYKKALDAKRWEEARKPVEAWLDKHKDDEAFRDLLCETYYLSSEQALQSGDLPGAIRDLQQLAKVNICYKKTLQRLEGLFTQQASKNAWDLAAQIFVTLEKADTINPSILQVFEASQPLRIAIIAITDIEEVWSIKIRLYWKIEHNQENLLISYLTFSDNNRLIGLGYKAGWHWEEYESHGMLVLDTLTGKTIFHHRLEEDRNTKYDGNNPIEGLFFESSDRYLCAYRSKDKALTKLEVTTGTTTSNPVQSYTPPPSNQAISEVILAKIRRQTKETSNTGAASPNGLYIIVAYEGAKLSLFRKAPSLLL